MSKVRPWPDLLLTSMNSLTAASGTPFKPDIDGTKSNVLSERSLKFVVRGHSDWLLTLWPE